MHLFAIKNWQFDLLQGSLKAILNRLLKVIACGDATHIIDKEKQAYTGGGEIVKL